MRSLFLAVGLTAVFALGTVSTGHAASLSQNGRSYGGQKAQASYREAGESAPMSRVGPTPPNCVREACGRLWCWHMRGESTNR